MKWSKFNWPIYSDSLPPLNLARPTVFKCCNNVCRGGGEGGKQTVPWRIRVQSIGLVSMHTTANNSKYYNSWWLQRPFFFQTQDGLFNVICALGTSRHATEKPQKEWIAPAERITVAPWWRILTLASTFCLLAQAGWTAKLPGLPAKQKWKSIQG